MVNLYELPLYQFKDHPISWKPFGTSSVLVYYVFKKKKKKKIGKLKLERFIANGKIRVSNV